MISSVIILQAANFSRAGADEKQKYVLTGLDVQQSSFDQ